MDRVRCGERFFFYYSLTLFLIVLVFFPLHAVVNSDHLPPLRPILHAHALLLGSWFALIVVQTWLIGSGRAALHQTLGRMSILLVVLMLPVGVWVSYENMQRTGAPQIFYGNSVNAVFFAVYFSLALTFRTTGALHKRFMMLACLSLMFPALARVGYVFGLNPFAVLPMWLALLLALPSYDFISERKIKTATAVGLGLTLLYLGILIFIGPPPEG
ncbi:hypothetical protein V0U79_09450 [Hyphobacterium sp. HN65]|uniref:Uncharacterized protein n=1 Tax=Hyphobacterium lacteum TaxID=3116575 RepID=A0ABU7LSH2_9PROT|nr:hypothetical protein [Hyphobacterium sp. HN65]MEE2526591.1 hypothetical protein [Hyphobacterium sp. HN65]